MPFKWNTIEGDGYRVKVRQQEDGTWHAKLRLEDDGERGKNLNFVEPSADELVARLSVLATAAENAQNLVRNEANKESDEVTPLVPEPVEDQGAGGLW